MTAETPQQPSVEAVTDTKTPAIISVDTIARSSESETKPVAPITPLTDKHGPEGLLPNLLPKWMTGKRVANESEEERTASIDTAPVAAADTVPAAVPAPSNESADETAEAAKKSESADVTDQQKPSDTLLVQESEPAPIGATAPTAVGEQKAEEPAAAVPVVAPAAVVEEPKAVAPAAAVEQPEIAAVGEVEKPKPAALIPTVATGERDTLSPPLTPNTKASKRLSARATELIHEIRGTLKQASPKKTTDVPPVSHIAGAGDSHDTPVKEADAQPAMTEEPATITAAQPEVVTDCKAKEDKVKENKMKEDKPVVPLLAGLRTIFNNAKQHTFDAAAKMTAPKEESKPIEAAPVEPTQAAIETESGTPAADTQQQVEEPSSPTGKTKALFWKRFHALPAKKPTVEAAKNTPEATKDTVAGADVGLAADKQTGEQPQAHEPIVILEQDMDKEVPSLPAKDVSTEANAASPAVQV